MPTIVAGTAIAALFTVSAVRGARPLEAKLAALHRLLILVGLACVVCALALLTSDPLPRSMGASSPTDAGHWQHVVLAEVRNLRSTISLFLFGAAWLSIPVLLVLGSLRTFVLEHRLDLATRMQIAARDNGGKQA